LVNDLNLLNVPVKKSVRYETNFIKTAVCEIRFPTLLELENKPPISFQAALRKQYPYYFSEQGVTIGSMAPPGKRYVFESKKRDWFIALKSSSLSLETKKYIDFDDFSERFASMLGIIGELLDTDFFTRVGLRYINSVPLPGNNMDRNDIDKWINPALVAPLKSGELGTLRSFQCEVGGKIQDDGGYTFRHGFAPHDNSQDKESLSYMLDYDYFKEGVEYENVNEVIKQFNIQNYNLFMWSLGENSIKALGKGKNKK